MQYANGKSLTANTTARLSWLFIVCFAINAIAPAFADDGSGNGTGKVLVCTANGLKWIDVNGQPSPADVTPSCVFCLNLDPENHDALLSTQAEAWDACGLYEAPAYLAASPSIGFLQLPNNRGPPDFSHV